MKNQIFLIDRFSEKVCVMHNEISKTRWKMCFNSRVDFEWEQKESQSQGLRLDVELPWWASSFIYTSINCKLNVIETRIVPENSAPGFRLCSIVTQFYIVRIQKKRIRTIFIVINWLELKRIVRRIRWLIKQMRIPIQIHRINNYSYGDTGAGHIIIMIGWSSFHY